MKQLQLYISMKKKLSSQEHWKSEAIYSSFDLRKIPKGLLLKGFNSLQPEKVVAVSDHLMKLLVQTFREAQRESTLRKEQ